MLLEYLYFTKASNPFKTSIGPILSQQRGNAHLLTTTPYWSILAAGCKTHKWSESHSVMSNSSHYTVHGILQARILEWVAFLFSRGSSQPRGQTQVSHIAGRLCTDWGTREAKNYGMTQQFQPGSLKEKKSTNSKSHMHSPCSLQRYFQ